MPVPEKADRRQDAVLWPSNGTDAYGQPTVGAPVQIKVRWLTKRTRMLNSQGEEIALDASATVDQRIAAGSQMWLGTLADWNSMGSSGTDQEVMEVKAYNETPDLKNRFTAKSVMLMRLHDK